MFPISDSIRSGKIPFLTILIIAANIFVFYNQLTAANQEEFIFKWALVPSFVNLFNLETLIPFITSMFLHAGFFHIAANMWFLWVFGDNVETHLGVLKFAVLYLFSGIVGGLTQYFINPASAIPMLGASAAVSGILAAYMVYFPHSRIKTLLILFFFITITEIPALIYIFYWFVIQLFSGIATLPFSFETGGVAFWAHIGGFLTGFVLAKNFKNASSGSKKEYIEGEIIE